MTEIDKILKEISEYYGPGDELDSVEIESRELSKLLGIKPGESYEGVDIGMNAYIIQDDHGKYYIYSTRNDQFVAIPEITAFIKILKDIVKNF